MRPGQQQNKRMRGRGRKGPNPLSRSYESNGPDVKIRGNAQHIAEKYIALARDANASGDRVMAENYLQHAEHYGRIVAAAQGTFQLQREETDFEGDYEDEGDETAQENGAPNGHPYPVPERAGGSDRPQQHPNQMQNNRDRDYAGGRDFNRDNQNRDNQNNREQRFNRDDRRDNRDGQNRDGQNRDGQGRDGQGREFQGRDRNRDFNRDRRDFNRNGNGDERRSWENRGDRQNNWQDRNERQTPGGLGPQPVVGEMPTGDEYVETAQGRPERNGPRPEERANEAVTANEAVVAQESGFGQAPAAPEVLAEPEGSILPVEGAAAEPRRRTRQRRPRYGEGEAANTQVPVAAEAAATADAPSEAASPVAETPLAPTAATEAAPTEAVEDAPAAKRPRGRPRKKKSEDEGADGDKGHVPDFLLASNG